MPRKILAYLSQHAIATVALVCSLLALAGSSYAALTISGSQIRNHTITPVKFDSKSIAGTIRAWADVYAQGNPPRVAATSSPVRVQRLAVGERITWTKLRFSRSCTALVTPESPAGPVSVSVFFDRPNHLLNLYGTQGSTYLDTFVAIICP